MKTIYFARHGQSEANAARITAGAGLDVPLTKIGIQQAAKTAKALDGKKIQLIVSSPMKRAYETALVIAHQIKYDPNKIVRNELFTERHLGIMTGKPHDKVQMYFDMGATPSGGESTEELYNRTIQGLNWLKQLPEDRILLVSHGGISRVLRTMFREENHSDINSLRSVENGELMEFSL